MSSRKHPSVNPGSGEKDIKNSRNRENNQHASTGLLNLQLSYALSAFIFLSLWLLLLHRFALPKAILQYIKIDRKLTTQKPTVPPTCVDANLSLFVYDLPPEFNLGLLKDCRHLNMFRDMCPHVANRGLGQPLSGASWFATNQFTAEMIFHARAENHPCRTRDPSRANLFYVPFYGGLYVSSKFRETNVTARDALVMMLAEYLEAEPWWQRRHGMDHFVVLGRTAWDFMREIEVKSGADYGASCLLKLPRVKNMSALIVERHPWQGSNQHGVPYPSYFHPFTSGEMLAWQNKVRLQSRPHLFSFVGAPRIGLKRAALRNEVIRQCDESSRCNLVKCGSGTSSCHEPMEVMKVMMGSEFCLQVIGDSFTRRSTFDSVLAGCIPVFFSPHTAYSQYTWFLPADSGLYSVYIEAGANGSLSRRRIEEELVKISADTKKRMRNAVVELIPSLTYAHPNATGFALPDAVDVALAALSKHVHTKLQHMAV
ncbi:probable xyloglucan galactosyltransferase GT17 [Malania oleifera]|uniref:probable xyloglucan galactosyltransferase GT17 n=1 Tax=Malania oleifera TaxID=397392 RepID=UPI0025AEBA55|nr:probable xyloglucan galactosyltransferase GT17 [Malania oleifera]